MSESIVKCALCGLAVQIEGFTVETKEEGIKRFCCAGCVSVYRLLNGDKIKE